ncbi:formyltetrahydrofolate deformylase [Pseudomonas taiwanensis]|uniref:formyltetrahydrofolate deformylase n=1 Tax=Pseudomonas TaxID=286 RepID=UPI0015BFE85E|nr:MULTISPECIES: formyltetrahydrofolate deformylase [Pseudomonas]MDH4564416.1 formyltetrahydrofolate deformylase [Pseudomonas sp. BN411]MDH4656734.1 formyltetrahydrofolate deformylase [Pseudomonas sp. BN606]MDH4874064.1 formyltetrahydrofolate deformylase [Pseudomonas sp. BN515]NWL75696.1 formyltetrahydrofolate deformylase [Pseudomonas taiwanensis]
MTYKSQESTFILNVSCKAGTGILAAISTFLADRGCYICAVEQFDDETTEKFFMRAVFRMESQDISIGQMREEFVEVSEKYGMTWRFYDAVEPVKTVIMVSKFDHCLNDLLYRYKKGELNLEIVAVISNHQDLRGMVEREGIRFVHLPVDKDNKPAQEARLLDIVSETDAELVILARYMQILSDNLSRELSGKCINIHHSFLPGFKGARPYHQAFERGVKLIGATAHYVTSDLDEGPIIEQVVARVDHNYKPEQLARVGRENECYALASAVKWHIERRVFLDDNKTVIFLGS